MSNVVNLEQGLLDASEKIALLARDESRPQVLVGIFGLNDRVRSVVSNRLQGRLKDSQILVATTLAENIKIKGLATDARVILINYDGYRDGKDNDYHIGTTEEGSYLVGTYDLRLVVAKLRSKLTCRSIEPFYEKLSFSGLEFI